MTQFQEGNTDDTDYMDFLFCEAEKSPPERTGRWKIHWLAVKMDKHGLPWHPSFGQKNSLLSV
jgi:hypothetical protein